MSLKFLTSDRPETKIFRDESNFAIQSIKMKKINFLEIFLEKSGSFIKLRPNFENEIRPLFYWKVIISFFIFLFIIVLALDVFIFWHLNKVETRESGAILNNIKEIDKDKLGEIIKEIDAKEKEFEKLILKKPEIKDPSLYR
ncbi:MAG: hypothetical protein A2909_01000 [Candidatus Tagabacteria bacterium RIFCSPLOWO2_01_FULL_39_11]|uniref:Uncharacterized protein n=1 Tax=Candidatus Tagabacteria bacterium RIFCSPLOWO2_01_FULL_39_11 TaxID=1802295 RepID=A0A1G2LQI9_9BACT|nr:MAG: hypothetical protein A2909_01000 [Candidatus Tagabacteria bacterium RIFCSPLOWO2_01_FULL_39_11]